MKQIAWAALVLVAAVLWVPGAGAAEDASVKMAPHPRIFLTPELVTRIREKAKENDGDWQALKADCDGNLETIIPPGYEGGAWGRWVHDYALAYQAVKVLDPERAKAYGGKALGLMRMLARDFTKVSRSSEIIGLGDGQRKEFNLRADFRKKPVPEVRLFPIQTIEAKRGAKEADSDLKFLGVVVKVSNSKEGPADYAPGKDCEQEDYGLLNWLPGGKSPKAGDPYCVSFVSQYENWTSGQKVNCAIDDQGKVAFTEAPPAGMAVEARYLYGQYQQTGSVCGGLSSVKSDSGYPMRNIGPGLAIGYDYCYDLLSQEDKEEFVKALNRWVHWCRTAGYGREGWAGNYFLGYLRAYTYIALATYEDNPQAAELLKFVSDDRLAKLVIPNLNTLCSGGDWVEGWNYGQSAVTSIVYSMEALRTAAGISLAEKTRYPQENVFYKLYAATPDLKYRYWSGVNYGKDKGPGGKLSKTELDVLLAHQFAGTRTGEYAQWYLHHAPGKLPPFAGLIWHDPKAKERSPEDLPLSYIAPGGGLSVMRSSWAPDAVYVTFHCGHFCHYYHCEEEGGFTVYRQGPIVINGCNWNGSNDYRIWRHNTILVGPYFYWWKFQRSLFPLTGEERPVPAEVRAYDEAPAYCYMAGDYTGLYRKRNVYYYAEKEKTNEVSDGHGVKGDYKADLLLRQILFLKPDILVIYDRVEWPESDPREMRWLCHVPERPEIKGDTVLAKGSTIAGGPGSTLQIRALYPTKDAVVQLKTEKFIEGRYSENSPYPDGPDAASPNCCRVETLSTKFNKVQEFLHVLAIGRDLPQAALLEEEDTLGVRLQGAPQGEVRFSRKGKDPVVKLDLSAPAVKKEITVQNKFSLEEFVKKYGQ